MLPRAFREPAVEERHRLDRTSSRTPSLGSQADLRHFELHRVDALDRGAPRLRDRQRRPTKGCLGGHVTPQLLVQIDRFSGQVGPLSWVGARRGGQVPVGDGDLLPGPVAPLVPSRPRCAGAVVPVEGGFHCHGVVAPHGPPGR